MFPRVADVRHIKGYELEVHFLDGTVAALDFSQQILGRGGVFRVLEDVDSFSKVAVDREAGTLVWPNGVDFCPDVLYARATGRSTSELGSAMELGTGRS